MTANQASILHADLDAFYASVEQRDNRNLRDIPMAVGGGIVLSASYQARALGVRTPMNINLAKQLCPDLVVVPPRMDAYAQASNEVFEIFFDTTPTVEALSIDEAFLDVSGLSRIAGVGIAISVGIARTKFLAKVASGVSKPDGLLVVDPSEELAFLHPLPVRALWGVGAVAEKKLLAKGIATVGEVASTSPEKLEAILGASSAQHLHKLAHNIDERKVDTGRSRSSVGAQQSFQKTNVTEAIEAMLLGLVDRVCYRLRAVNKFGKTVVVRYRFGDFKSETRSFTFDEATNNTTEIASIARSLLRDRKKEIETRSLTQIGLSIANLTSAVAIQQTLSFDQVDNKPELDGALDEIHNLFGNQVIGRASNLNSKEAIQMPSLPDF